MFETQSPRVHEIFGSSADETPTLMENTAAGISQPLQQAMVCMLQTDGRCIMVQQQPHLIQTDPSVNFHEGSTTKSPNLECATPHSELPLQLMLFLVTDALKVLDP